MFWNFIKKDMTPEQKLFYLSLYLGASVDVMIDGNRFALCGVNTLSEVLNLDPGADANIDMNNLQWADIKLILKEEPASYHEDDKANKAYWEEFYGKEQYIGTFYGSGTARSYVKPAGILWLIQNKYDIFNLKSQDLAIYE